jgi:3-hydroxyacyl-CoA dehydrogenase/enoyl-CoA hydratase/3-hydroxybutyryl-CoA epimerase
MSIERALSLEAEALADLLTGRVSKNLVHLFFLSEKAKKDSGVEGEVGSLPEIRSAGLLGAGTMGGGMAWALSSRDIRVRLKDVRPEALGSGLAAARRIYDRERERDRLTAWELDQKMTLISPTMDWSGFGRVDVVLEAIVEDLAIKKKVLQELEPEISDTCLIGSNTSTLPITELQAALGLPERMAGLHFFNPVDRMPLIEVIRGEATSRATVAAFVALAKRLGKTPVVVADCPGFLVNRVLGPYLNEAGHLLRETGDVEGVDRALLEFGMPMGPLRLIDEIGVDIAEKAGNVLAAAYGDRATPAGVTEKLVEAGRLGKKSGRGFYRHQGKTATPDPEALAVLAIARRGSIDPQEAVERCVYAMIGEAARCLDETVVAGPEPLDVAMVMGAGFPPFRGGLLRYADSVGLKTVVERLQILEGRVGPRFRPPETLIRKAQRGEGFYA